MSLRQTVYMDLGALQVATTNPKMHDIPTLVASLHRFGWTQPVMLDERTGKMVAGHGRREALIWIREHGEVMPDGVILDDDGEWLIPVNRGWSSRNDLEADAYIMADNQTTMAGSYHMLTLAAMLENVVTEDAGLLDTLGFSSDDVDDIIRRGHVEVGPITAPDPWADRDERKDRREATADVLDGTITNQNEAVAAQREQTCPACGHHFAGRR